MAPAPITEDFYMVLEVGQTATPELVIRSYKRLALKLHPDRNINNDTTEAFQLLGRAYETLKDENKRRAYDLIYPSITRGPPPPQNAQTSRPPPGSTPQSAAPSEAAQIIALQRSRQERSTRWWAKKNTFESSISKLQREIRQLEQEIKNLDSIVAAEVAEEAQKNSWATWLLSPIYKKAEDSEEEKARKDRERQERRIEKDMKERRLGLKNTDLKKEEGLLRKTKEEIDAADLVDNRKIRAIQERVWAREALEKQEREREERERLARIRKQQQEQREKQMREAVEAVRKKQAEERAAELKRQEEETRRWQKIIDEEAKNYQKRYAHLNSGEGFFTADGSTHASFTSTCSHGGWWPKIEGRTACPKCSEIWTYLLQCPGCKMMACPRCQSTIRPRRPRNTARTNRRTPPSPNFFYDDY